jgi:hypothetical protein
MFVPRLKLRSYAVNLLVQCTCGFAYLYSTGENLKVERFLLIYCTYMTTLDELMPHARKLVSVLMRSAVTKLEIAYVLTMANRFIRCCCFEIHQICRV